MALHCCQGAQRGCGGAWTLCEWLEQRAGGLDVGRLHERGHDPQHVRFRELGTRRELPRQGHSFVRLPGALQGRDVDRRHVRLRQHARRQPLDLGQALVELACVRQQERQLIPRIVIRCVDAQPAAVQIDGRLRRFGPGGRLFLVQPPEILVRGDRSRGQLDGLLKVRFGLLRGAALDCDDAREVVQVRIRGIGGQRLGDGGVGGRGI